MKRFLIVLLVVLSSSAGGQTPAPAGEAPFYFALAAALAADGEYLEAVKAYDRAIELEPDDPYLQIEFAELLIRLGRLDEALAHARKAREGASQDAEILRRFARIALRASQKDSESLLSARSAFEELRERDPEDIESLLTLGQIYLGEGRPKEAVEVFREILGYRPDNRMVAALLVDALLQDGRVEEATVSLRDALDRDPDYLRGRLILADLLIDQGTPTAAVALLQEIGAGESEDPEVLGSYSRALYQSGLFESSVSAADRLLAIDPENHHATYIKALGLLAQGLNGEAEEYLRTRVQEGGERFELSVLLVRALERQGKLDEARVELEARQKQLGRVGSPDAMREVVRERLLLEARAGNWAQVLALTEALLKKEFAGDGDILFLKVEALVHLDDIDGAIELLEELGRDQQFRIRSLAKQVEILIAADRDFGATRRIRELRREGGVQGTLLAAEAYQRSERYAESIPLLRDVTEADDSQLGALFSLGAAYERTGARNKSTATFERLIAKDPEFAPALNYLGYMWADEGENLEEALRLVERAVALDPGNGAYLDSLGWAHFQLGNHEAAEEHLVQASRLVPNDATVLEHLGDLALILGRKQEAVDYYRQSIELAGENQSQVESKLLELQKN